MRVALAAGCLSLALAGCVAPSALPCRAGEHAMVSDMLYFGTATPHGNVSVEQWNSLIDAVVAPRFPQGLTVWPASGQWRSTDGMIIHEGSHVLAIVHADEAQSEHALLDILAAYKSEFDQEAVLRVRSESCVSF